MKASGIIWIVLQLIISIVRATDNGLTTDVTWDQYSLMIHGERVYIQAGEFHYPRLPVPTLWRDVLEKFKANGLNTVSIYFFWNYHSARPGVFDFKSPGKDIQKLLDIAKDVGLWVIARPGPYVNGEINGGGLPLWGSDGSLGTLRTNDATYQRGWLSWIRALGPIVARNQITNGGPVIMWQIENELSETVHLANDTLVLYMEQLKQASRDVGIVVPFSSNEKGMRAQSWSTDYQNVGGAVNIYGLDSYPGGMSCTNPDSGFRLVRTYHDWFQNYSYTQPPFLPEFEGGYFQPWGGSFYDTCAAEHSPEFADVYYKNNIGQGIKLQSLYMAFGGTNWGNLAAPVVYTSYDYSAPLNERREVTTKFMQTKLIALFTRASPDLRKAAVASFGAGNSVSTQDIYTWEMRNADTSAGFYVLQQNTSQSRSTVDFQISLQTSIGDITVSDVQLAGRQSKIVTTDYHMGKITVLYSTADVLNWATFGSRTVLVLYSTRGQVSEFAFPQGKNGEAPYAVYGDTKVSSTTTTTTLNDGLKSSYTKFKYTQAQGATAVEFQGGLLVWLLETETAWTFFAPATTKKPNVGPGDQILVLGPYNVRSARVEGSTVNVIGDNANTTTIEVFAKTARTLTWNGRRLATTKTPYGSLVAKIPGVEGRRWKLPESLQWRTADSLPERRPGYDDSRWVVCNKTTSLSPRAPLSLPVLFSSDYGYYAGIKLYRGYFNGSDASSVNITVDGGRAAGFSAWLNGHFVGYNGGNTTYSNVSELIQLPTAFLRSRENVLTVVVDYTGHDETSSGKGVENPRGILGVQLMTSDGAVLEFSTWKIQGNAGGDANIDPIRGPMNEDGLYGTRLGWHLPGFEASGPRWSHGSPNSGLKHSGISWYHTKFELNIDSDLDVPVGLELVMPAGTVASVQLYINGYQYGKYMPHTGPQTRFPFPPGILNTRGDNTLLMAVWAMTDTGASFSTVKLFAYGAYQTGFDWRQDKRELQPRWSRQRLEYA